MPQQQFISGTELAQRFEQDQLQGLSTEILRQRYGSPPHWFQTGSAPRYGEFKVHWQDHEGRQYMFLEETQLAVRLPIRMNRDRLLGFPSLGQTLILTEHGGGQQRVIQVYNCTETRSSRVLRIEVAWKNAATTEVFV